MQAPATQLPSPNSLGVIADCSMLRVPRPVRTVKTARTHCNKRWSTSGRASEASAARRKSPPGCSGWHRTLLDALAALPEDHRDALLLHTQVDMPLQEIAELKIAAVGTVKAWMHRARRDLALALEVER